jgi:DNA primase
MNRATVMKSYPNGAGGEFFFQKRVPEPHPEWVETCEILHASGNKIHFPMIQDLPSLLWVVNLGCIDLNQWYATCDDVDRPDYLHFDLDPGPGATFEQVLDTALAVRIGSIRIENFELSKNEWLARHSHLHTHSPRADTKASLGLRKRAGARAGG